MAQILTQKVLTNEILKENLLKWISETNFENEEYKNDEISQICSQKDFVTYFLNVIHEQLTGTCAAVETPQKPKSDTTPHPKFQKRTLFNDSTTSEQLKTEPSFLNDSSHHTINTSCTTSTPKNEKSYSYNHADEYFSPIQKNSNSVKKYVETSKSNSVCLGDFIVPCKKNNSKKKVQKNMSDSEKFNSKRLNPTNLNEQKFNIFAKMKIV
ncbi:hypothetical protein HHI36_021502 [Cryptolaemus montrouzieri]|uniref:Uncharacterized protein n=1 Tax=Cryptolaemus montrouzieri TaxID=559131 RepID=A0ABD2MXW2_9CUCU